MKLITLNTWGGKIREPLLSFIKENEETDIFCLQEIYHGATAETMSEGHKEDSFNLFTDLKKILTKHTGYFRPVLPGYGLAIFLKQNIQVHEEGEVTIFTNNNYISGGDHSRNLQYAKINIGGKEMTIVNVHGLWNGMGKTDTEDRLNQSKAIRNFIDSVDGPKIVCGDFNLRPDTKSIEMLEEGMRNLIKEYNIASTRTSLYEKPEQHADYMFTSPEIKIEDFKVLPDEVSDHAALSLEFET